MVANWIANGSSASGIKWRTWDINDSHKDLPFEERTIQVRKSVFGMWQVTIDLLDYGRNERQLVVSGYTGQSLKVVMKSVYAILRLLAGGEPVFFIDSKLALSGRGCAYWQFTKP